MFTRCGRARCLDFGLEVGTAEAVPTRNTASIATMANRVVFIPTPPRFRKPDRMSEAEPQAEANRARNAEDSRSLQSELVGRRRIDAFVDQLLRHGRAGFRVEIAGRVRRARSRVDIQRVDGVEGVQHPDVRAEVRIDEVE